jgi:hypothetical protein
MSAPSGSDAPPAAAAAPVARAHPPSGASGGADLNEVVYQGRARHSINLWNYSKWVLLSLIGGAIDIVIISQDWLQDYTLYLALLWLIGIPGFFVAWIVHRSKSFKVTRRRIESEYGILTKRVDSLELWRVLDVRYEQSLIDRMFNNGKIILIGTDQTDSTLVLHGLPRHREIFEILRDAVQLARHSNRPVELVPGQEFDEVGGGMGEFVS